MPPKNTNNKSPFGAFYSKSQLENWKIVLGIIGGWISAEKCVAPPASRIAKSIKLFGTLPEQVAQAVGLYIILYCVF